VKQEESLLRENKQEFLLKHKRLREQQTEVERNQANIDANQDILNRLFEEGIIDEAGNVLLDMGQRNMRTQ
jgi:hypothetical protein